jgi:hypothetical protein
MKVSQLFSSFTSLAALALASPIDQAEQTELEHLQLRNSGCHTA